MCDYQSVVFCSKVDVEDKTERVLFQSFVVGGKAEGNAVAFLREHMQIVVVTDDSVTRHTENLTVMTGLTVFQTANYREENRCAATPNVGVGVPHKFAPTRL